MRLTTVAVTAPARAPQQQLTPKHRFVFHPLE
jgi:hypothetical protein